MNYKTMEKLQNRQVKAMEFFLHHDTLSSKRVYVKIPDDPKFADVFNHPCQKWFDKGYYISIVYYHY